MANRSLQASDAGIQAIKKALKRKQGGQTYLAGAVKCSRQTIWSLLQGNPIDCEFFTAACAELGLNWEEIAKPEELEPEEPEADRISTLVQNTREQMRSQLQQQYGTMRVLDMTQPIALTGEQGIYTNVNILEKLTGRRRLELSELLKESDEEEFDRFGLSCITEERVPGLDAAQRYPKLMVLGKPGAGKTTFLKYLTMQCMAKQFLPDRLPLFVTLKNFAEAERKPSLLEYLVGLIPPTPLEKGGFGSDRGTYSADTLGSVPPFSRGARGDLNSIIVSGKALILLDGLDEVRKEDTKRVIRQIEQFSEQFPNNHFVITCRIAAKEYTFEQFTEVEVADFDKAQIDTFAQNWFRIKGDSDRANLFRQKLDDNKPIAELATNPLLLTLLCLIFAEKGDLPKKRHKFYQEGIDLLLEQWDTKRFVERDRVYRNLSLKQRKDLLSKIALHQFKQQEYFFEPRTVENLIAEFLNQSVDGNFDPEADSKAVLKSIEAHHGLLVERAKGIYSFSHLTFQEYFVARAIVASGNSEALKRLSKNIAEKRWREVFLLTLGMTRNAEELVQLMKQQIDQLIADSDSLQQFLNWVQKKSNSVSAFYRPAAIRAFYCAIDLNLANDFALASYLDPVFDVSFNCDLNLTRARRLARRLSLALNRDLDLEFSIGRESGLAGALDRTLNLDLDPEFRCGLEELKNHLPDTLQKDREKFDQWWRSNGKTWADQLRSLLIKHRNIGHDWQFTGEQGHLLQQYYDANKLLVDCLNSDCYVSRTVREAIEDTLLLPIENVTADG